MSEWNDNNRLRAAAEEQRQLKRLGACDPRLLERLGVRREVCEAAARHVHEKEVGK